MWGLQGEGYGGPGHTEKHMFEHGLWWWLEAKWISQDKKEKRMEMSSGRSSSREVKEMSTGRSSSRGVKGMSMGRSSPRGVKEMSTDRPSSTAVKDESKKKFQETAYGEKRTEANAWCQGRRETAEWEVMAKEEQEQHDVDEGEGKGWSWGSVGIVLA